MKLYQLIGADPNDGQPEYNGIFINKQIAEQAKKIIDEYPSNKRYGIKQYIEKIETADEDWKEQLEQIKKLEKIHE